MNINCFSMSEGFEKVSKDSSAKFLESVDVACNINFGKKKKGAQVRGVAFLPHGNGRKKRVALIVGDDDFDNAKDSNADRVGGNDIISDISKGLIEYDCYVASPDIIRSLGSIAKILGPKGLMPSAKSGTVTRDFKQVVSEIQNGARVEYRSDKNGVVHVRIGNVKFTSTQLADNLKALLAAIYEHKLDDLSKMEIDSIFVSSTMGSSVMIDAQDYLKSLKVKR